MDQKNIPEALLNMPKNQIFAYGCVFCMTGKEQLVAEYMEQQNTRVLARAVYQTKRHTKIGKTVLCNEVVLPGYVLFEAPADLDIKPTIPYDEAISLLTYSDGDWRLYGEDETYARWVFKHNGVIGLSKAYQVGDRIQIVEGPLKDIEGSITRVDRRNRSGQVNLTFGGKQIKVWLGFEIIEEFSANERAMASGDK